jgi:hypothetical protein
VRVWYSSEAIYFGIRAYEPHGRVIATLADRDRVSTDDNVEIHLDTFDERNRAFVFIVNPLGIQADGTKNEAGGFIPGSNVMPGQDDLSADFVWQSRGHVTEWGYEVEIRIPFGSLRYPLRSPQRWGLQIDRHVQHSGYEETWTPAKRASASFIGQAGWITDLTGMRHGEIVEMNPELTNTVNGTPCCDPTLNSWHYASAPRLGGNVRWTLGSNFVLNGTARPDFSQVEADATQIAADQRFALFYPEKRPFFVEGADRFNVPNTLVYTRTIVQPDAALKVTGKLGRADLAVLSAIDQSGGATPSEHPLVDVMRLQQNFGEQSFAGCCTATASRMDCRTARSAATRTSCSTTSISHSSRQWRASHNRTARRNPVRCGRRCWTRRAGAGDFTTTFLVSARSFAPTTGSCRATASCSPTPRTESPCTDNRAV